MMFSGIDKNNFEKEHIDVGLASEDDAQGILEIQKERLLSETKNTGGLSEAGFLINPISESDILDAINNPENSFIFVARNKTGLVTGYFLAYDFLYFLEKHPEWKNETGSLSTDFNESETAYGKHVATKKGLSGVGTALDNYSFNYLKEKGYKFFIAEICEGPIKNIRSAKFHQNNFDLFRVGEYKDSNQYDWGVYAKKL